MYTAIHDRYWVYIGRVRHLLYKIFFFFMPFTQALTFNIGFPLKFSELALFLLAFLYLLFGKKVLLPRPLVYILSLMFVVITLSFLINLRWDYPYPLRIFETRFGYTGDSIARYLYFILALLSFFISVDIFLTDRRRYINAWIYGAIAAALYSWYLVIASFLGLKVILLPGMPPDPQTIGAFHRAIIRSGTFLEGNMTGLYLLLSAAIAFYGKKVKTGIFLLVSVFSCFSTLSMLSVILFLLIYLKNLIFQRRYITYILPAFALLGILIFLFSRTTLYKEYIYDKIFANTTKVTDISAYSKTDRLLSIQVASHMGWSNPVWGVGLANYSRHFDHYMDPGSLDREFVTYFSRPGIRVIPNNIYLELWSESGGMALVLFLLLQGVLLWYSRFDRSRALFPALLCMMLCFIAYPSFIMIYLWAFMALPVAEYVHQQSALRSSETTPQHE